MNTIKKEEHETKYMIFDVNGTGMNQYIVVGDTNAIYIFALLPREMYLKIRARFI